MRDDSDVEENDIVFCQIKDRFWARIVKSKEWQYRSPEGWFKYTISNIHGYENGWTDITKVYGKLISNYG